MKANITLKQVQEIQEIKNKYKNDISGWKIAMKEYAVKTGLTDREILEINRGDYTL